MLNMFIIFLSMAQKNYIFKYIFFFIIIFYPHSIYSKTIIGKAIIVDGDTLKIGINKIRLHGIDSPELEQKCLIKEKEWNCGKKAAESLFNLANLKEITCESNNKDRYNRYIAICYINALNINKWMVKNGWAIAYRYYSLDYINDEEIAKMNKSGIWQGKFTDPFIFRKNNR